MLITSIIPRRGINDEGKGKKHALFRLITEADSEYVWLHDDDVVIPSVTEAEIKQQLVRLGYPDMIILPLRMSGGRNSLLERLQRLEYTAIQSVTMDTALAGKAVMCSGANMIVRRDRWLESYADLHPELASGDDMFLLESFRRKGLKIVAIDSPQWEAVVTPIGTWKTFIHQRMRWAGKAPQYHDRTILRYGLLTLSANLLQIVCPFVLIIKFPWDYLQIKKRDPSASLIDAFLLEILYPWYILLCLIGGILTPKRPQF